MILPNVKIQPVDNRDKKGDNNASIYGQAYQWGGWADPTGLSYEWESFDKFEEDIRVLAAHTPWNPVSVARFGMGNMDHWLGISGGDGQTIVDKINNGWPELLEKLERMLEQCELETPPVPSRAVLRRRKIHRSDHGDHLDMGRVWNGELDIAWTVPKREEHLTITTKRVTLAVDITSNGGISSNDALWRAALGMKLVDSLVKAGRILEIWVIDSSSHPWTDGTKGSLWAGWCVKRTADPLVMDRLCSMMGVGMMRVCGFLAMHADTDRPTRYGGALNYGLTATLKERQNNGELVLRIGECYNKDAMIKEYNRAWMEVINHSEEVLGASAA